MTRDEAIAEARRLAAAVEQFGALVRPADFGEDALDDLLVLWERLDNVRQTATAVAREASTVAARLIGFNRQYEGPVTVHTTSQVSEKSDGRGILMSLVTDMIEPETGEKMLAIPLDVLLDILPAVGEGQTSSKWKKSGLKNHDIDPEKFIKTEYGPQQVRLGPKPRR